MRSNPWFRRLLILLTVGGGFTGITVMAQALPFAWRSGWISIGIACIFIALNCYGVALGFRVAEGRFPAWQLTLFFLLQLPVLQLPVIGYQFATGLQVVAGVFGWQITWGLIVGSSCHLALGPNGPYGVGINVAAALLVLALCTSLVPSASPDSAERVKDAEPRYDY
jgi:hypothetical protein